MQKINLFILKHILGIDPYVLKQEKDNNSGVFFSLFTLIFLFLFFFVLFKSIQAILYDLHYGFIFIFTLIAFTPFYNVFSFALVSWRSHNSYLSNNEKNKLSEYTSTIVTLLIRCTFLFLTLGMFMGLSYTLLNKQKASNNIEVFKNTLILKYEENLKKQVEIDNKLESREYFDVLNEINKLDIIIAQTSNKLDSLSYLSIKKPLVEKEEVLKKEMELKQLQLLTESNRRFVKYKAEITKNPFFLKSLIFLSSKTSFLIYVGLISLIFGVFMFLFWWRFVRSTSTYFKIDNHLHRNAIIRTSTPIIKSTIEFVKTKFNYDYKTQFPMHKDNAEIKIEPDVILNKEDFIKKLRKNEL